MEDSKTNIKRRISLPQLIGLWMYALLLVLVVLMLVVDKITSYDVKSWGIWGLIFYFIALTIVAMIAEMWGEYVVRHKENREQEDINKQDEKEKSFKDKGLIDKINKNTDEPLKEEDFVDIDSFFKEVGKGNSKNKGF